MKFSNGSIVSTYSIVTRGNIKYRIDFLVYIMDSTKRVDTLHIASGNVSYTSRFGYLVYYKQVIEIICTCSKWLNVVIGL